MTKRLLFCLLFLCSTNVFSTPVNVNTADAKTISDSLSGIGLKKADDIVKYRTEKGPFKTIDELDAVKGIGKKTIEKNKADILLDDSSAISVPPVQPVKEDATKIKTK